MVNYKEFDFTSSSGFDLVSLMAKETGIDHQVFGTALTEMGVNYAFLGIETNAMVERGIPAADAIRAITLKNTISVAMGLRKLQVEYPNETMVVDALTILKAYLSGRGACIPYV